PEAVRLVILGGEAAHTEKVKKWNGAVRHPVLLINSYGPTEATIVATTAELGADASIERPPIGTPIAGVRVWVLGRGDRPSDEGELVLGGPTIGLRYVGDQSPL